MKSENSWYENCGAAAIKKVGRAIAAASLAMGLVAMPLSSSAEILAPAPYVISSNKAVGSFLDVINFDVSAQGHVVGTVMTFDMPFGTGSLLHISDLSLSLFDSVNQQLGLWSGSQPSFDIVLSAGSYRVNVSGIADGVFGGAYTIGLATAPDAIVSSIPEPESWLFMLLGVAMLGIIMRRRYSVSAAGAC